jgi:hypothetical protein
VALQALREKKENTMPNKALHRRQLRCAPLPLVSLVGMFFKKETWWILQAHKKA